MHKIRWDDLQFVRAVAERGSLSAAARFLGVNHATVLRRIVAFEEAIGTTLFKRPPGGYRIKPEMREVLDAVEAMGRTADRLERVIPTIGKGLEGTVTLTTTDSLADGILPRILVELARLHPKLNVDLVVANQPIDMERPEAEITIRPARTLPEGLTGRRICSMSFQAFASPDYLAAHTGTEPQDHTWLGAAPPLTRSPVGPWQDRHVGDAVRMSADSFQTLARLAEAGLGITMLPSFIGRRSPLLVEAPHFPETFETGIWVATHPDLLNTERVSALFDFLAEAIAADADLLA